MQIINLLQPVKVPTTGIFFLLRFLCSHSVVPEQGTSGLGLPLQHFQADISGCLVYKLLPSMKPRTREEASVPSYLVGSGSLCLTVIPMTGAWLLKLNSTIRQCPGWDFPPFCFPISRTSSCCSRLRFIWFPCTLGDISA